MKVKIMAIMSLIIGIIFIYLCFRIAFRYNLSYIVSGNVIKFILRLVEEFVLGIFGIAFSFIGLILIRR